MQPFLFQLLFEIYLFLQQLLFSVTIYNMHYYNSSYFCYYLYILKINGHDVNQVTAEEAIDIIHNSKEPVVVEVLNKVNKQQTCNNNNLSKMKSVCGGSGGERDPMVTIATQTDALTEDEIFEILDPDLAAYQYQMFALTAHR